MFKSLFIISIFLILFYFSGHTQYASVNTSNVKEAVVTGKFSCQYSGENSKFTVDTFFVRNRFILEPIYEIHSYGETTLNTSSDLRVTKNFEPVERLMSYNVTDLAKMVGMEIDIKRANIAKSIEVYKIDPKKPSKKGLSFLNEPLLSNGIILADYAKEKDTIIDGKKCFLIKCNKSTFDKSNDYSPPRVCINPSLPPYQFSFISEQLPVHFGGAIVLVEVTNKKSRVKYCMKYTYRDFTAEENKLFDRYKALYDLNLTLLDRFNKK